MKTTSLSLLSFLILISVGSAEKIPVWFGTGSGQSKGIYRSTLDQDTGKLSPATLAAEIGGPGFLALHPDGQHLYAVCRTPEKKPGVGAWKITGDKLSFLNAVPIDDGGGAHIAVHPSGKFLITAQYGGGSVALFPLKEDGHVGSRSQIIEHEGGSKVVGKRQDSPHPHWCGFDASGGYAFVPDLGLDGVAVYKVDLNGPSMTRHGFAPCPPGSGPRHMKFSADQRFVYVLTELSLAITVFAWDPGKGELTSIQTIPTLTEETKAKESFNSASEIRIHPSQKFLYSANRGNDTISAFKRDTESGKLSLIEIEPIRGAWPRNFNIDPSGKWLLTAGRDSNTIAAFEVSPDSGELTYKRSIISVPGPICVLFPNGS